MTTHQIVIDHLPLAAAFTRRTLQQFHPVDMAIEAQDILQDARVGLVQAAAKFDGRRSVPFGAFARRRIDGAIRDGLRRNDHLTRDARRKLKASGAADQAVPMRLLDPDKLIGKHEQPDNEAARAEAARLLGDAISTLPARLRCLLDAYYHRGQPMRVIGSRLHVNESRVSQLHKQALRHLRVYFEERGMGREDF